MQNSLKISPYPNRVCHFRVKSILKFRSWNSSNFLPFELPFTTSALKTRLNGKNYDIFRKQSLPQIIILSRVQQLKRSRTFVNDPSISRISPSIRSGIVSGRSSRTERKTISLALSWTTSSRKTASQFSRNERGR